MYFKERLVYFGRRAHEPDAPARHGERLGKAGNEHGPLPHPLERGDGYVLAAVGKFGVDLVGNDQKIVLFDDRHDGFELFFGHDAARGVVGIGQNDRLCTRGDRTFQHFGRDDKPVFAHAFDGDGVRARKMHAGKIGNVTGLGDQNIVADLADRAKDEVDTLARAHGHDDVVGGIGNGKTLKKIAGNEFSEFGNAAVARVLGIAALYGADGSVADMPGRDKVRLAHAEGDGALHFRYDVEKFTDAARL